MIQIETEYKSFIKTLHSQNQPQDQVEIVKKLTEIKNRIIEEGDKALIFYTEMFDKVESSNFNLKVSSYEIEEAYSLVPENFISALKKAKKNIEWFHNQQIPKSWYKEKKDGSAFGMRFSPIQKAGLYVPGGRAPYPSSVLMDAVPAKIAGVSSIVMTTPPDKSGKISPQILVAADICGIKTIIKAGGAQAVFAMAYGSESVDKVDKIAGPGNMYVTVAKQMVYGQVDIDKPAGPSEALVYIDNPDYAVFAAAELLSQLEHDPDSVAAGVSENKEILYKIQDEIKKQIEFCSRKDVINQALKNSVLFLSKDIRESIDIINTTASEHLVLLSDNYKKLAADITNAGAVFLGPYTPVALGDYYAGTNHVLPTAGAARFASPLGVMDFMKYSSLLYYSREKLIESEPEIAVLTEMEGFDAHHKSVTIRTQSK
ncbi:MAG: histidinol dehydrogenase [bacterium]|nr:histidinol dehydrogenase [bacterium]